MVPCRYGIFLGVSVELIADTTLNTIEILFYVTGRKMKNKKKIFSRHELIRHAGRRKKKPFLFFKEMTRKQYSSSRTRLFQTKKLVLC